MSTKSGPYDVTAEDGLAWSYQHDLMGENFDGDVFYVWGPMVYLELPRLEGQPFIGWHRLSGLPKIVLRWLDAWPCTPDLAGQRGFPKEPWMNLGP